MEASRARAILRALHEAQGAFYAGGPDEALRALLIDDIVWHVPGDNAIAGDYRGRAAVMDYFARRRDLAGGTFRMHPGEVLLGDGDHVAVLTDGTAIVAGREWRWSTVGLYRLRGAQVAACCPDRRPGRNPGGRVWEITHAWGAKSPTPLDCGVVRTPICSRGARNGVWTSLYRSKAPHSPTLRLIGGSNRLAERAPGGPATRRRPPAGS